MGYDLHTHSIFSDGSLKPAQLVRKARERGLAGIALTDHDCIGGLPEARREAQELGFVLVPGVEMTTDYGAHEVHILGYFFNPEDPSLNRKLDQVLRARNERARHIIAKLNKHRIPLSWEKVAAKTTSRFVGRSHIFRALEEAGYVNPAQRRGIFEFYLGINGIAYVPHQEIDTEEAIGLINRAGGIAVVAHPGRMNADSLIEKLVGFGVRGLEVHYPTHTPDMVRHYLKMARDLGLYVSGGSDYHGAFSQTKLGDGQIDSIEALLSAVNDSK